MSESDRLTEPQFPEILSGVSTPTLSVHPDDLAKEPKYPPGRSSSLFKFKEPLRYYFLVVLVYALASLSVVIWAAYGPALSGGRHVLQTGTLKVDQFYSGLALSALLTPAAVVIRTMSKNFSLLHPFAIAARKPITTGDFDRVIDLGPMAIPTVWKYSWWHATVQATLMLAGAVLVPLGTLVVTTDTYAPANSHKATVGLPLANGFSSMIPADNATNNYFMNTVLDTYRGSFSSQSGILAPVPREIGPVETDEIPFQTGVTYTGILMFTWTDGCESAEDEISFHVNGWERYKFAFPDGDATAWTNLSYPIAHMWDSNFAGEVSGPADASRLEPVTSAPLDSKLYSGTTYYGLSASVGGTYQWPKDRTSLTRSDYTWASRVKCTPSMKYHVRDCTWNGRRMDNCTATSEGQGFASLDVQLDTAALDKLTEAMVAVPYALNTRGGELFGESAMAASLCYTPPRFKSVVEVRAPGLQDYRNFYGTVAQAIAAVATSGFYGKTKVFTIGEPPRPVYVVRMYMGGIVLFIFVAVAVVSYADVRFCMARKLPFRKVTFLTVASAVRGPWWDEELYGGSVVRDDELRKRSGTEVMFGVDVDHMANVGLAPRTFDIEDDTTYYGIDAR